MLKGRNVSMIRAGSQYKSFSARFLYGCGPVTAIYFLFFPLPSKKLLKGNQFKPIIVYWVIGGLQITFNRVINHRATESSTSIWTQSVQRTMLSSSGDLSMFQVWKDRRAWKCKNQVEQTLAVTTSCLLISLPPFFNYTAPELQLFIYSTYNRQEINIQNLQRVSESHKT